MDGKTMEEVRNALLARWKHLQRDAAQHGRVQHDTADHAIPQAEIIDIAQALEQIERDVSLAEQGRRELDAIERALAKMATRDFGICEDCGEEIPSKRLVAVPSARLCANCQTFQEKQSTRSRIAASR